ncbi:MAG: helix-turn-helix domain-containing protein [Aureliella sp.]
MSILSDPKPAKLASIPLERPASVKKLLGKSSSDGWLLPSYWIGPENEQLSYLFSDDIIRDLAHQSPIVLFGPSGSGKTALAVTLAVRWSRVTSLRPMHLTTGADFASQFSEAIEIDDSESFRSRNRGCKLLLIDHLEKLATAPAAQVELAATIDELREARRPVIVTSSRLPAAIAKLKPRLRSRLSDGLSLKLSLPSNETCKLLLRKFATRAGTKLDIDALAASAGDGKSTALTLKTLVSLASGVAKLDGSMSSAALASLASSAAGGEVPAISAIAKVVARRMNVRLADMRGSKRDASIVRARGLAAKLARSLTPSSLQEIGQYLGGRDHSTILHALKKTDALLATDTDLATAYRELKADLTR